MQTVKEIARHVLQHHYEKPISSRTDHLLTFSDFRARYCHYKNTLLTDQDIWLVIRYLHRNAGVAIADDEKSSGSPYMIVKFPESNETESAKAEITMHDKTLVKLRYTSEVLNIQVDKLQSRLEEFAKISQIQNAQGHRPQALYALKRKKHLETLLHQRLQSLETMEAMLLKFESSLNDMQLVEAFNMGADALRSILKDNNITVEMVDATMVKLGDVMEDQREVETALSQGMEDVNQTQFPIDEDELENELRELDEKEAQMKELPSRQESVSAPPPAHSESELARLNALMASVGQSAEPPRHSPNQSPDRERRHSAGAQLEPAM
ncbi:Snf7-domain-containing protein [Syncephalastrum racemosum]|uniref:Vacuolar-sorting protein SNF7 n=1 Tax=Syncephalastrum racemosum TaxID=13706 RepID=A0A1X2H2W8_SYNRA|nr:Snf7-domain-containing protein [Syncephalastrum racemosum]